MILLKSKRSPMSQNAKWRERRATGPPDPGGPAHAFTQEAQTLFPRAPGKRTRGQMARFSGFQKKKPGQLPANRAAHIRNRGIGVDQATRRSPASAGQPMIRRSSAATPSSTARFSFIRLEWL